MEVTGRVLLQSAREERLGRSRELAEMRAERIPSGNLETTEFGSMQGSESVSGTGTHTGNPEGLCFLKIIQERD